jgi:hypothetical protein
MRWALELAPPIPAQLVATLAALAFHADKKGRGAYPSANRLAAMACKDKRSIQRDLRALVALGLIRLGDQSKASHLPTGQRPEVYDLAVERTVPGGRISSEGVAWASRVALASSRRRGGKKKPTSGPDSEASTGDVDVTGDTDVTGDVDVPGGVTPTSQEGWRGRHPNQPTEPTTEPKDSCSPPAAENEADGGLFAVPPVAKAKPAKRKARTVPTDDPDFDEWYAAYPRHEAKDDAAEAYRDTVAAGVSKQKLLAAAHAYAASRVGKDPQYLKLPAGWLRTRRYNDELPATTPVLRAVPGGYQPRRVNTAADFERQQEL